MAFLCTGLLEASLWWLGHWLWGGGLEEDGDVGLGMLGAGPAPAMPGATAPLPLLCAVQVAGFSAGAPPQLSFLALGSGAQKPLISRPVSLTCC